MSNYNNLQKTIIKRLASLDKEKALQTFLQMYKQATSENEKQQIFKIAKALQLF